jgi:hypothetical protein
MTVCALEAAALGAAHAPPRRGGGIGRHFSRVWFQAISPAVDAAWKGAMLEDFRFPELAAQLPMRLRPLQWYMERVHRATHRSALVTNQFYRVMNFLDPPTSLLGARIASQVLLGGLGARKVGRRGETVRARQARAAALPGPS